MIAIMQKKKSTAQGGDTNDLINKYELEWLLHDLENKAICLNFNDRKDTPFESPPIYLRNFIFEKIDQYIRFGDIKDDDYYYAINLNEISEIYFLPEIPVTINGKFTLIIQFINGDCLSIEELG